MLEREFKYYKDHQQEIVAKYDGKFVVIKNESILGAYDSEIEALQETQKDHKIGTFLIQKVSPGRAGYTQTFHSRLAFR